MRKSPIYHELLNKYDNESILSTADIQDFLSSVFLDGVFHCLVGMSVAIELAVENPPNPATDRQHTYNRSNWNIKPDQVLKSRMLWENTKERLNGFQLRVTEYAPDDFAQFREMDGVSTESVLDAIHPELNRESISRSLSNEGGRGGEFVYFTHDHKFVIKAISKTEKRVLINDLLPSYITNIRESENRSLVSRIYGVFTIATCMG
jgi:hypothetical protein